MWVDTSGRQHVRISFPRGYSSGEMISSRARIKGKASSRVRAAILARRPGPLPPVRIERVSVEKDGKDQCVAVTYRQVL